MRPEIIDWCENRPITIRHDRVGSFSFMLGTRTIQNYYIDWGDGVVEQKQFNNWTTFSHTYTEAGTKTIIIRDLNPSEVLKFYISTTTIAVTDLDVSCALKIEELKYQYCQNSFGSELPSGFLDNYKKLTKFENGFKDFSALTTLPVDLFRYNTAVTNFSYVLYGCYALTTLPTDLFRYNTAVTNFGYAFRNCSALTTLPVDLFRYNTLVTNFNDTFSGCSKLTSLPATLFQYNTAVTSFDWTFYNCTSLTTLPVDLFRYNTAVTNFSYAFSSCHSLTTLPVDLFRYNTAVTNFSNALGNCSNISGEINMPEARLCSNLSEFAAITKITKINFPENFAADVAAAGVNMTGWINHCKYYNAPISINFKLSKFTILSYGDGISSIPSIRLLNQNSTFTGSTPQVDISGVVLSTEATNQLLTDLPSGLTDKTIKLRTGTVCDSTIAIAKNWSVIFG